MATLRAATITKTDRHSVAFLLFDFPKGLLGKDVLILRSWVGNYPRRFYTTGENNLWEHIRDFG